MKKYLIKWEEQGEIYTKIIKAENEKKAYKEAENIIGYYSFTIEEIN